MCVDGATKHVYLTPYRPGFLLLYRHLVLNKNNYGKLKSVKLKVHVQFRVLSDSTALACHSAKINVNIIVNINLYAIVVNITQMVYL